MASTTLPFAPSSSTLINAKACRQSASPRSVSLPPPPSQSLNRALKTSTYSNKVARNVVTMASGEAPAATVTEEAPPVEIATEKTPAEAVDTTVTTELPEIVKTVQKAWDKVEDKYAVSTIGVAGVVALWGSTGMISAIDRLPLIPGVLELVGIGYTGWFAYKNLVFKPDREILLKKIKDTYSNILGNSSS